ncbi:MAG: hypothetical protein EOP04_27575 [Proteobacteria bacterium]|nr:MAG: hypothetical protein EOP04_27575 [Pseudomonadota bacterium]
MTKAQKSSLDNLHKREGQYLEDTPNGNILIGFDNYLKTGTGIIS